MRAKYPGKKRYVTTEDGHVFEWKWSSKEIPLFARSWTVETMTRWVYFDNEDRVSVMAREFALKERRKKQPRKGNAKADVDPRKL